MEYDANALRAAGMSEEAIAQVLGFNLADYQAQYKKAQADQAAALAAAQATGMSDQYTQLYGGADIVPGTTQGILSNLGIENPYLPVYSLIGSASVGNDLANERMQFAPIPGVSYRLVDKTTGETTTANTPEEIKALIEQSNALSAAGGKGANLAIESNQTGSWSPVFTDAPNPLFNDITKIALAGIIAATGAGLLQPGGLGGVGAAGTTGATTAGTTAAGSGLVPGALTGANALSFAPIATTAIPAGAAASDFVITALMAKGFTAAQAAALVASGGAAAALSSSGAAGSTTGTTPAEQPSDYVVTAQVPTATTPAPIIPGILPPITPTNVPAPNPAEDIVATAQTQTQPVTPTPVILPPTTTTNVPPPNPAEDIVATAQTQTQPVTPAPVVLPPTTTTPNVPAPDPTEDIKVTAPKNTQVVTPPAIPPVFIPPTTTPPATTPTDTTPPAKKDDFLGTGLSLTQLATLLGLSVEAVKALFGGGGSGTTPTTPYVSPFGAMGSGFGAGVDYRVNPNIIDYERYGFGPEASFFRPEYSGLVSRAAGFTPSTTQTASGGGTANPVYQPLIGPNNPAAYQQGGPNPDAMRLMNFNPMSGLTGNGILDRLQQQFNQAGSTYVSKTDGTVPTQLTQEELWGIMS